MFQELTNTLMEDFAGEDPGGTPKLHKEGKNVARVSANWAAF